MALAQLARGALCLRSGRPLSRRRSPAARERAGMSSTTVFELLGVVGISIGVLAYVPQVVHLAREHCSAGVSARAWAMWLTSSLLIGALALHRHDPVFIGLQASSLISAAVIVCLTHRYRGMACEDHAWSGASDGGGAGRAGERGGVVAAATRR